MTEIYPFKGILYNPQKIKDPAKIFCPPYDIISEADQQEYYKLSPYNFVRLELSQGSLDENSADNRYDKSQKQLQQWLKDKVLIQDEKPAFYLYEQHFDFNSSKFSRVGIFAALKLSDGNSGIFPHEHTLSAPKADRLKLIKKVEANLSPIFCMFSDDKKCLEKIAEIYYKKDPLFDFMDKDSIRHKFWRIDDPGTVSQIQKDLKDKDIFIADGHHRFEVACQYRDFKKFQDKKFDEDAAYNFVMVYLTDAHSDANLILPYHRVVIKKDVEKEALLSYIKNYFIVDNVKQRADLFKFLENNQKESGTYGVYFKNGIYALKLKDKSALNLDVFKDYSAAVRKLDVVILDRLIFSYLKLKETDLVFTKDEAQGFKMVDAEQAKCAVFLNPTRIEQLEEIVSSGLRMPQKSTYFYPKVLSGLVVNSLKAK